MPKAIVVAVGDTPLNPLNDLLKQNTISTNVIDAAANSADEIDKLIKAEDQCQCVLLKGVKSLSQHVAGFAGATDKLVLLYCSPTTALSNSLESSNGSIKPELAINQWQESVGQAMELAQENDSYLLCDLDDILNNPSTFLAEFFAIEKAAESKPSTYTKKQFANHLATLHLFEQDEAFALYDEALSIGKLFGEFTVHLGPDTEEIKQSAVDSGQCVFNQLINNHQEIQAKATRVQELQQQLNDTVAKQVETQARLENIKSEKNEVEQALSQMTKTHEERVKELESQLESLKNTKLAFEESIAELNDQLGQSKTLNTQQSEKLESLQQQLESTNIKLKEATENKEKVVAEYDESIKQSQQHTANLEKEKQKIVKKLEEHEKLLQSEKQAKHELEQILLETKQANQIKDEQLNQQSNALAEQNNQVTALKVKIAELQQTQESLLAEKELLIEAKEQQQSEIKSFTEDNLRIMAEHEAVLQQLEQAHSETKQTVQDKKAIESQYQVVSEKLEIADKRISELEQLPAKLELITQQYELAELQIAQSQEELESTAIKMNELTELPEKLEQAQATIQQYEVKIEELSSDKTLTEMQVVQLQEELEATLIELTKEQTLAKQLTEQAKNSERIIKDYKQLQSDKDAAQSEIVRLQSEIEQLVKQNKELQSKCQGLTQQVNAATQAQSKKNQALISELQSQLEHQIKRNEQTMELKNQLENQLKESEAEMTGKQEFHQAELELSSLQIKQLHDELEFYYSAWQKLTDKGAMESNMPNQQHNTFTKAQAESFEVIDKYQVEGYEDIHCKLTKVRLADGRTFDELPVKIVNSDGFIAVEIRDQNNLKLFRHSEDATDEFGPYLRIFANTPESLLTQQKNTYNRMNASERILVMSCISLAADLIHETGNSCNVEMTSTEWRNWRLAVTSLKEMMESLPVWLSFDSVTIREELREAEYEHIWLSFSNVLLGEFWRKCLEVKLAATGLKSGGDSSAPWNSLNLEFRELDDGSTPLLTWPPETEDEFGPKLTIKLNEARNLDGFAAIDIQLISHLVDNLPSIIDKVEVPNDVEMTRSKSEWSHAISNLVNQVPSASEEHSAIQDVITTEEVVSMGSYQHLLFNIGGYKVKLKAHNINPDTFDAEIYLELRNGTPDVIYNDTGFFGEDEYGPRVLFSLESIYTGSELEDAEKFDWLFQSFERIQTFISTSDELDDLIKRLWINMISRKRAVV